jgi:hypothetical protein
MRTILPFFVLVALTGCVAVTNLDRFNRRPPTNPAFSDIEFSVSGMTSHVKEYFEARIVSEDGVTQTLLVSEVLGGEAEAFTIPAGAPLNSAYKLEFFADHNHDGVFDLAPDPADHSWIVAISNFPPDPLDGVVRIPFAHTTNFNTLEVEKKFGKNALIHVANVGALAGKRIQLRVADASSKHTVGMYRVPVLAKASFDAQIRGIIDPAEGTRYQLEVSVDNGGAAGDKVTGSQGFRDFGTSGNNTGLEMTFDPAVTPPAADVLPAQESPL